MARKQAARAQGNPVDLAVEVAEGARARTEITVEGIRLNDRVVSVVNLTDGAVQTLETVGHKTITVTESTSSDTLLVVFWSVGLGGNPGS